jgi:hypothetical protein
LTARCSVGARRWKTSEEGATSALSNGGATGLATALGSGAGDFATTARGGCWTTSLALGLAFATGFGFLVCLSAAVGFRAAGAAALAFFATDAERAGALNVLAVFLPTALGRLLARGLLTEARDAFEDFAMVRRRRSPLRPRTLVGRYHLFEQKNSGLKSSSTLRRRGTAPLRVRMSVLFDFFPTLSKRVAWVSLGALPTRVEDGERVLSGSSLPGELWLKRDDLSSPIYGGNKLRLLEHLLGEARARGCARVYSSGAVGSNFALATALHAPRVGLEPGAICFPEPLTPAGEQSHRIVCALARVVPIAHWSLLPVVAERVRRHDERDGHRAQVLSQVSLGPESLFGYVAAGLELLQQIERRECPPPARIVLPIGSAATSAGILAGLSLGKQLGFSGGAPLQAVRIAAWPLSRRARVVSFAVKNL